MVDGRSEGVRIGCNLNTVGEPASESSSGLYGNMTASL